MTDYSWLEDAIVRAERKAACWTRKATEVGSPSAIEAALRIAARAMARVEELQMMRIASVITGREASEQECLGCGHVVRASKWFVHSQECRELERIVELALSASLPIEQLGEMYDN